MKKFIAGILFYVMVIPILESLVEMILGYIETLKIENTKKVTKGNIDIMELQAQTEQSYTNAIGFEVPSEEYYDEEEWEDKTKNKIGF